MFSPFFVVPKSLLLMVIADIASYQFVSNEDLLNKLVYLYQQANEERNISAREISFVGSLEFLVLSIDNTSIIEN